MTFLELTALHYLKIEKKKSFSSEDLANLIYIVAAIRRQPKRIWDIIENDSKSIVMNTPKMSKKFKYFQKFILDVKDKFAFTNLETVAFVCWFTFNYLDLKSFQKNNVESISDKLISEFHDWYKNLNANVHIIYGFKQSCQTILNQRKSKFESCIDCINRLIEQDKISELYYSGGITPYFLAAIPNKKIEIPKSAIFSSKLFALVNENRELLISKLNSAGKNYFKIPIDSLVYLEALRKIGGK